MRAELLEDRGDAASSDDFFRSRPFYDAEGVTHSLGLGGLHLPVIVREVPGAPEHLDAISPYGYPGAAGSGEAPSAAEADWSATGLVSLFARDRIGAPPCLPGGTERSLVQVHDPALKRSLRPRLASQIRRNQRRGWEVRALAGPEATAAQRRAFLGLYTETMTRTGAAARYFHQAPYFEALLAYPRSWLLQAESAAAAPGAGAIAALSDGLLHYYLGGTADDALEDSPFKNVVAAMLDLADELDAPLNLGGGLRQGDGLEDFKRGFANSELPFVTHEVVCDPAAYEHLSHGRDAGGFFPAYRA
ncbi:MAG: GNAT family N-acetyltransferase [bacterium]